MVPEPDINLVPSNPAAKPDGGALPTEKHARTRRRVLCFLLLLAGLVSACLLPPFESPDEMNHLVRAFQLSQGQLVGVARGKRVGSILPKSILDDSKIFRAISFRGGQRTIGEWYEQMKSSHAWTTEELTTNRDFKKCQFVSYPPVPHLPQTCAALLGRIFELRTGSVLYLGRLLNVLVACGLIYLALRHVQSDPRLEMLLFLVAAMPMSAFLFGSLNADAVTIGLALLAFAMAMTASADWSRRQFAGFLLVCALLALSKSVYLLLPAIALPQFRRSGMPWRGVAWRSGLLATVAIIPLGVWLLLVRHLSNTPSPMGDKAQTDMSQQVQFLLHHPLMVLGSFWEYGIQHFSNMVLWFVGCIGCGEKTISPTLAWSYLSVLLASGVVGIAGRDRIWRPMQQCVTLAVAWASVLLIFLAAYLAFGTRQIAAIQGRYFIPIAPLFLASLPVLFRISDRGFRVWRTVLVCFWVLAMTWASCSVAERYWSLQSSKAEPQSTTGPSVEVAR